MFGMTEGAPLLLAPTMAAARMFAARSNVAANRTGSPRRDSGPGATVTSLGFTSVRGTGLVHHQGVDLAHHFDGFGVFETTHPDRGTLARWRS